MTSARLPAPRVWIVLASLAFVSTACASAARTAAVSRPRLRSVAPDSVRVIPGNVTEVVLVGTGFDTARREPQNTVRIGAVLLRGVPSVDGGTLIRVVVPSTVTGEGEAPPARWLAGRYPVTVTTRHGTSDTLTLAILTGLASQP